MPLLGDGLVLVCSLVMVSVLVIVLVVLVGLAVLVVAVRKSAFALGMVLAAGPIFALLAAFTVPPCSGCCIFLFFL